ncbi:hypothetical protein FVE85_6096 [Porphyridium purpureum]|uniref:Cyclin N-terminal domain-containing protein n=1 Tax=Porphyridium purpureum TaxID=35688 RepID=A0A5J4Z3U5_PORPP|nr:hypothetical protein FVE85_6096 [Porphyridium purpureum]|eukprot:POR2610..scf295_1
MNCCVTERKRARAEPSRRLGLLDALATVFEVAADMRLSFAVGEAAAQYVRTVLVRLGGDSWTANGIRVMSFLCVRIAAKYRGEDRGFDRGFVQYCTSELGADPTYLLGFELKVLDLLDWKLRTETLADVAELLAQQVGKRTTIRMVHKLILRMYLSEEFSPTLRTTMPHISGCAAFLATLHAFGLADDVVQHAVQRRLLEHDGETALTLGMQLRSRIAESFCDEGPYSKPALERDVVSPCSKRQKVLRTTRECEFESSPVSCSSEPR